MALTDYSIDTTDAGLDPKTIERKRLLAEALAKQGSDYSPIKSPWQGLARVGDALIGGLQERKLDQQDKVGRASANAQFAAFPGSQPAAPQASVNGPAAASGIAPEDSGRPYKFYSAEDLANPNEVNPQPSPLDPPSGDDRKKMMATILGEAGNEPQLGKNAVASVIRTRAVDGGYGGDTPSAVVQAPNQFEPWNTPEGRARMAAALQDPKQAAAADAAIKMAYGEGGKAPEDPTEGMTHFYSPKGQTAMGRPAPAWAGGDSVTIGGHVFNSPDDATPANAQPAQGRLPTAGPQVAGPGGADMQKWALGVLQNPRSTPIQQQVAKEALTAAQKQESYVQETDKDGNIWNVNKLTGQKIIALKASDKEEKNAGLMSLGAGSEVFDPKSRTVVHKNETPHDATLDDKTTNAMADQYLAGDRTVLQNLGRGAQGAANIVKLRQTIQQRAEDAGVDPKGIVNNFNEQAGALAGQRAVGTRAANISLAANEANNMIPIALDASDKLPRTQWMPYNQMVQAVQKGSSSPELASFVAATNSLVNSYVRAVSPSGVPTDSMRQHAYDMLNAAQGPQAYKSVVNTMQLEMKAALQAPAQVRKELRKGNEPEGEAAPVAPPAPKQAPEPPKVGDEVKGHRFLGGDPSNPASWAKLDKS